MHLVSFIPTFEGWQNEARRCLAARWFPETIQWQSSSSPQPVLQIFEDASPKPELTPTVRVPKRFIGQAKVVALHSGETKWDLLYRILWRLTHDEPRLLENPADPDFISINHLEKEVTKDAYRMTAFVRFREIKTEEGSWFVAWYEPEHDVVRLNAEFFTNRFGNMQWSILTPRECMHWDRNELSFTPGVDKSAAPSEDNVEPLWITYYSRIFNPARLKVRAMQAQLLKRNWKNLPEATVIEPLIRNARSRTGKMIELSEFLQPTESDFSTAPVPRGADWSRLREAASTCKACPLWKTATCTVFGEGPPNARIVFVGEQPGDQEDKNGKPFIGPAGQVFDRALNVANIDRSQTYVTNAVKHFKFEPRGKRRIHKTASSREIAACRPWLEAEIELIKPDLIVALGSTACQSLFDYPIKVLEHRGSVDQTRFGIPALITVHPSSLLRLPPGSDVEAEFGKFATDLKRAQSFLDQLR